MASFESFTVQVQRTADDDAEDVAVLTQRLRAELLELEVDSVEPIADTSSPEGAKGLETLVGWLSVRLGKEGLKAVIGAIVRWADDSGRDVRVVVDGQVLNASGVSAALQEKIVNAYLDQLAVRD